MENNIDRQEIEKQVLRDVLIKSFKFPRFDTLQEYLRQRAGVSDDELQEIRYQIGAMGSLERMEYVSWKEHVAEKKKERKKERKKEFFKSSLPKLLVSDVDEKEIQLWIEMGELSEEDLGEARHEAEKSKNDRDENSLK